MCREDVAPVLQRLRPQYFAIAPESHPLKPDSFNTGVMLMNINRLLQEDEAFTRFCGEHLPRFSWEAWDQSAYIEFFQDRMDSLSPRYNWKPYWSAVRCYRRWGPFRFRWQPDWADYRRCAILHFHGPKPHHQPRGREKKLSPLLQKMTMGQYHEACDDWRAVLAEAQKL
jgi:lipopolysaccharide biosynthesis glycosyltransferase